MPIIKPFSTLYPRLFPAGYSGSQVLRFALKDGPEQRLYQAADYGLAGYKSLQSTITASLAGFGSLYGSISGHNPSNITAAISAVRCQALSPKKYIVGYEDGVPQFIETRQQFRCVSFISSYLKSTITTSKNLPAAIKPSRSSYSDLSADITGGKSWFGADRCLAAAIKSYASVSDNLATSIIGSYCQTLSPKKYIIGYENGIPQFIETCQQFRCVDFLFGYIRAVRSTSEDLLAVLRGWVSSYSDLGTYIIAGKEIFSGIENIAAVIKPYATLPGSLSASVVGSYCQTLSPKIYVVGYENGVPKFLEGRQRFRCVDFLPAYIKRNFAEDLSACIFLRERANVDLPVYLNAVWKQGDYGLRAILHGWNRQAPYDLPAFIWGVEERDLQAIIGMHSPENLPARLNVMLQSSKDLPASVYGWDVKNLLATVGGVVPKDLPAYLFSIPPKDLPAYLKVWPQEDLPANLHGWGYKDLGASISWNVKIDLPAIIGGHPWENLGIILKGWVREATADLPAYIRGFTYEDMQAIIRATYIKDLPAYLYSIPPKDLPANLHGWDTKDLSAILVGGYGPNDIQAYINAYNWPQDLPVRIIGRRGVEIPRNLGGVVSSWYSKDLGLHMNPIPAANLNAYLVSSGGSSNLPVYIYPKMINLTTIISIGTMEHLDIAAVINLCGASAYSELRSYIRCMYLKDLGASIEGKKYPNYMANLGARIGYADSCFYMDKLPLTVSVASGYIIEDKLPLSIHIFKQLTNLMSYITATPRYSNISASLTGEWLKEYEFENYKHKEMVYDLNRTGHINWNEVVELVFETIVDDYFYIEANQRVHKMDKYARWVLEMSSYVPENTDTGVRRKLHRMKKLYDLTRFNNMDEAVRFAINYVTEYNYGNLSAIIAATGGYANLSSYIQPKYFTTTNSNLSSSITVQEKTFILGFDDKIEFH